MILAKYSKLNNAKYLSHLDVFRAIRRTLKRADLQVNYSSGFSPHELIYFANPLSLSVESECEYFLIDTNEKDSNYFLEQFNKFTVQNVKIQKAKYLTYNPNLAHIIQGHTFEVDLSNVNYDKAKFIDFLSSPETSITCNLKGVELKKNLTQYMQDYKIVDNTLFITIRNHNGSVKVGDVLKEFFNTNNFKIKKVKSYISENDKYIECDEYFDL